MRCHVYSVYYRNPNVERYGAVRSIVSRPREVRSGSIGYCVALGARMKQAESVVIMIGLIGNLLNTVVQRAGFNECCARTVLCELGVIDVFNRGYF